MSQTIVQINFDFDGTAAEYYSGAEPVSHAIAQVNGLLWKVWLFDAESGRGGGIYLFESREAAQAYLAGPIVAGLGQSPAIRNVEASCFGIEQALTTITRGPVAFGALAG